MLMCLGFYGVFAVSISGKIPNNLYCPICKEAALRELTLEFLVWPINCSGIDI
jgi:hypothetical protein